jgi:TonB family protein
VKGVRAPGPGRSGPPPKLLWAIALCGAIALHAGGLAAAWPSAKTEDADDQLGAPAIEIAMELTAPHKEQTDLPPGPEADASTASAATVNQQAKVEQTDLPKEKPTETEDPDRAVAPDAAKTPSEDQPNTQESKANPTAESIASEAVAPPTIPTAREAPISAAPAQGSGESATRVKTTWQKELSAHLNRFKRYPGTSTPRGMTVTVNFTLDRLGHVVSASIAQSSGDTAFDNAALAMLTRADPVPPPPPLVADEGLTFTIPVIFRGKKK